MRDVGPWTGHLGRRRFLRLGAAALAAALLGGSRAAPVEGGPLRIGFVLPPRTGTTPSRAGGDEVAGEAASRGAEMGEEDVGRPGDGATVPVAAHLARAPDADAAGRAAERLVALDGVTALCGGFDPETAVVLATIAAAHGIPFLNLGASADGLRGAEGTATTFHIEPSTTMYLGALSEGLDRHGFRRPFVVADEGATGTRRVEGFRDALARPHLQGEWVGSATVPQGSASYGEALERIRAAEPDVVVLLLGWLDQLDFLGHYEAAGLAADVTGFPEPVAQTRPFYAAAQDIAPRAATGLRVASWEATAVAHGAGSLNDRFLARWGVPMDPPAWSAYAAVQVLAQAAAKANVVDGRALVDLLRGGTGFDLGKGPAVAFRPRDGQLLQPLYLVRIAASAPTPRDRAVLIDTLTHRSGDGGDDADVRPAGAAGQAPPGRVP